MTRIVCSVRTRCSSTCCIVAFGVRCSCDCVRGCGYGSGLDGLGVGQGDVFVRDHGDRGFGYNAPRAGCQSRRVGFFGGAPLTGHGKMPVFSATSVNGELPEATCIFLGNALAEPLGNLEERTGRRTLRLGFDYR